MKPSHEQCFHELGITTPTIEQKRALVRLVMAECPDAVKLERARLGASEATKRLREDDARVDVLRDAIERVLALDCCSRRVRRILNDAAGATMYDGRTARQIKQAAEE